MSPSKRRLVPQQAFIPALLHDIGKICDAFQSNIYKATGAEVDSIPELRAGRYDLFQMEGGGHAALGLACLADEHAPEVLGRIVGEHHGRHLGNVSNYLPSSRPLYGGESWFEKRHELLLRLVGKSPQWPLPDGEASAQVLSGLTVVADWIASGPFFDDPDEDWPSLVPQAVDAAGFVTFAVRPQLSFSNIFSFEPRAMQRDFISSVQGPGVYLLEAPMGLGKTEAALYAAYRMLVSGQSSGLYFALPTQLTSNRIHSRVSSFLGRILTDGGKPLLLHGKSWLHEYIGQVMGAEAAPEKSWFNQGRRGLLAPFAVGTVDQALLAAMHVRHARLRAFGLAGKTVILDEVHSYDAYTGCILDKLVELLTQCNCTVIILSATLTAQRRTAFTKTHSNNTAYPLISAKPHNASFLETASPPPLSTSVLLCHVLDDGQAVEEALKRAEQGQRVLWVENTVKEAQTLYGLLSARALALTHGQVEVGLLHSRFTPVDRAHNEETWTTCFAPDAPQRGELGFILVGTQVVEQSLDLDADFLVTRFCPTDMLLQRLGRLWRHGANAVKPTPRPPQARCEAWLLHPDPSFALLDPKRAFGPSGFVYAPYVLCRSLEQWRQRSDISLPQDIRPILERTYAERVETLPPLIAALQELQTARDALRSRALYATASGGQQGMDEIPPTRLNQRPEADVLLLRQWHPSWRGLLLADGSEISLADDDIKLLIKNVSTNRTIPWRNKGRTAARLALNMVRVPEHDAPPRNTMTQLERWVCCDNLRVALIRPDDSLCAFDGLRLDGKRLSYRSDLGYMVE